jgi:hypothetical protein
MESLVKQAATTAYSPHRISQKTLLWESNFMITVTVTGQRENRLTELISTHVDYL